jgi:molybdenum cofactor biosynthesis enzyme MoaA
LQNVCNADCDFCEFCGLGRKFDEEKFKRLFLKLHKKIKVNKLSFTGGEPTLDLDLFKRMVSFVKSVDKDIFVVVNTNGLYLDEIKDLDLDSVALSRHHYDDSINQSIFKTKVPTAKDIYLYNEYRRKLYKPNLHLSCNLVKGYIDSQEEVFHYLDFCDKTNSTDVGFVGLMGVNDFCREHYVDYSVVTTPHKKLLNVRNYSKCAENGVVCRCGNYVYGGEKGLVNLYCRHYCGNNKESIVVYDVDVYKHGFNGEVIDDMLESF